MHTAEPCWRWGSSSVWKLCPGQVGAERGGEARGTLWPERRGQAQQGSWVESRVAGGTQGLTEYFGLKMPVMWFLRVSSALVPLRSCSWKEAQAVHQPCTPSPQLPGHGR